MLSIGIDLSLTSTGYVVLENGKIIDRQLIKIKPMGDTPIQETKRLMAILEKLTALINKFSPIDIIILIEGIAFMARNTRSICQLAGLNYLLRGYLYIHGIDFIIIAPTTLKKFITGKGNCGKELMLLETYKRYNVSFSDNNLCDAYALAQCGQALLGNNTKHPTKHQQEVLNLLAKQYAKKNS